MGKYMKKCKGTGGIAVMEVSPVGVRTRARTLALATAARKKKSQADEIRTRRPENPIPARNPANSGRVRVDRCPSPDTLPLSRCSSNASCELVTQRLRSSDPEGAESAAGFHCSDRRETTPSSTLRCESDDLDSTNSRRKPTSEINPSEEEIEAFFSTIEKKKDDQRRFTEKYNYDVVKDTPLEGRYEWVRLKI